ncbi:MAG: hypothetical protein ABSA43_02275 [Candidatus Microgenomates bacterium]|jgi:hypothetical protein
MRKNLRHRELKKRRSFWPTLILTFFWGGLLAGLIYFIDPTTSWAIPIFFLLVFLALLFGFCLLFVNTRRGFLTSLALTIFLLLRYFGIGNILNLLLISGITASIEIYCSRK